MYSKWIAQIFIITCLAVIQFSFFSGLPNYFNKINIAIIAIIFILSLRGFRTALFWSVIFGILFDFFSFFPFGFFILIYIIVLFESYFLLVNFFTNRSLYSFLAVVLSALICHEVCLHFASFFYSYFFHKPYIFQFGEKLLYNEFWMIISNFSATALLFYVVSFVSRGLKPVFLTKNKKII